MAKDKKERPWTEAGDVALKMYLDDGVEIKKIAEDLKRSVDNVRERIELIKSQGKLDDVDLDRIADYRQ